jgi:hypothetical protein
MNDRAGAHVLRNNIIENLAELREAFVTLIQRHLARLSLNFVARPTCLLKDHTAALFCQRVGAISWRAVVQDRHEHVARL